MDPWTRASNPEAWPLYGPGMLYSKLGLRKTVFSLVKFIERVNQGVHFGSTIDAQIIGVCKVVINNYFKYIQPIE